MAALECLSKSPLYHGTDALFRLTSEKHGGGPLAVKFVSSGSFLQKEVTLEHSTNETTFSVLVEETFDEIMIFSTQKKQEGNPSASKLCLAERKESLLARLKLDTFPPVSLSVSFVLLSERKGLVTTQIDSKTDGKHSIVSVLSDICFPAQEKTPRFYITPTSVCANKNTGRTQRHFQNVFFMSPLAENGTLKTKVSLQIEDKTTTRIADETKISPFYSERTVVFLEPPKKVFVGEELVVSALVFNRSTSEKKIRIETPEMPLSSGIAPLQTSTESKTVLPQGMSLFFFKYTANTRGKHTVKETTLLDEKENKRTSCPVFSVEVSSLL
ncbi:MAG: uncharacterized protein A8A55_1299 [Amphiamblys sp. WSBS2006]|nr:MAG: uncharacterized protein A8A55_1299 [Amphiamblys sp. WSBS2006]